MHTSFPIQWLPRSEPLTPCGVAAFGAAARALAARLLLRSNDQLAALRGVAGNDALVVTGNREQLPWCSGAIYLGRDEAAPSLLLPTLQAPDFPAELLARAFGRSFTGSLLAILPSHRMVIPLDEAGPISRAQLVNWLERDSSRPSRHLPAQQPERN